MKKLSFSILMLTLAISSILTAQVKRIQLQENIDSIFRSGNLVCSVINPHKFKVPRHVDERVILFINQRLYAALPSEIHRFIQDMFDEGIDVKALRIDDGQFKKESGAWKDDAGHHLKFLIMDAYQKFNMEEFYSPRKRGLILLGSFPAEFISWQQEDFIRKPFGWADIKLTNDFKKGTVLVEWKPYPPGQVSRYKITAYEIPDLSKISNRVELPGQEPGQNPVFVPFSSTRLLYHPPMEGQKNFQFKVEAVLSNGSLSPPSFSEIVNWNFLINPSDYVLADIDGFKERAVQVFEYTDNGGEKLGIRARPVMVVTRRVESNPNGFELSSKDKQSGRQYADCEMYFGRIDAYSLTGAWEMPEIDNTVRRDRKIVPDRLLQTREISLIRDYLNRNHEWRKNKALRSSYDRVYFFRSSDFVNPLQEKEKIAAGWRNYQDISQVLVEDAKLAAGCTDSTKPHVILYSEPDHSRETVTVRKDIPDIKNIFKTTSGPPQSLRIVVKGTGGAVRLFSQPFYKGKSEIIWDDKKDLNKESVVGANLSSIRLLSCDDINCSGLKPAEIYLYSGEGYKSYLTFIRSKKDIRDLSILNINDQVSSLKIKTYNKQSAVVLYSNTDFSGDFFIAKSDIFSLDNTNIKNNRLSSLKFWNCFQLNSPSWDHKHHLIPKLREKWKLVDLGVHGSTYGFTHSDGELADERARLWDDRVITVRDIWNLGGDIKFLINHCCFNGQFMAPGNAGTTFLFRNKMLAQWCWSGSGTVEHEVLHSKLRQGERFGVAVLENCAAQMSPQGANPWRSYFTVVLGDPTLRFYYLFPDLQVKNLSTSGLIWEKQKILFQVTVKNMGEREMDQNLYTTVRWKLFAAGKDQLLDQGEKGLSPLGVEKEIKFNLSTNKSFPAGRYRLQVEVDGENMVRESEENNNDAEISVVLQKKKQPPHKHKKVKVSFHAGGLLSRTDNPLFMEGEPSGEMTHQEYPSWRNYQSVNTISWKGGISFEYQLNPILAVELGADYTEYRLRVEKGDDDYFDESSLKSINLPLLLKLKLGGRKVHAFIGGGVEGSYFLSMKHHYFRQSGDLVFEEFFGEDEAKFGKKMADLLQSRFSYSVVGLAGFQVGPFYSEARYCLGLKDIALDLSDTAYGEIVNAGRMKGWSALFGFRF